MNDVQLLRWSKLFLAEIAGISMVFFAYQASADMTDADYQSALQAAQKKVARVKAANARPSTLHASSASALSSTAIRNLLGRPYQVGDHWLVAAWSETHTTARMTGDPEHLGKVSGTTAVLRYEVVNAPSGTDTDTQTTLKVTQLERYGAKRSDGRIESLLLHTNGSWLQSKKTYQVFARDALSANSGRLRSVNVSPDGIHSSLSRLELFPLDVPELATAEPSRPKSIPALPDALQAIADQAGYRSDATDCTAYEQDDFFGRPVQVIWRRGDPWPTYLKTSNGVAVLLRDTQ